MAEFASKGVAGTGLGFGIAGTALGVASGGLKNIFGGGCGNNADVMEAVMAAMLQNNYCSENTPVSRYELNLQNQLGQKDSEISNLKSDKYTDQKIVDTYTTLHGEIKELAAEVRANKEAQVLINQEQAVYNGVNTATVAALKGQIDQLMALTALRIPNTSVCPGWGSVNETPATSTTTSSAAA